MSNTMISRLERFLEITNNDIEPLEEFSRFFIFAACGNKSPMEMTCKFKAFETCKAISKSNSLWGKMFLGPTFDLFRRKTFDSAESNMNRSALLIPGKSSDKRCFTCGSTASFSSFLLSAPIHIIKLNKAIEWNGIICLLHDHLELMFDSHGCIAGDPEKATHV